MKGNLPTGKVMRGDLPDDVRSALRSVVVGLALAAAMAAAALALVGRVY